MTENPNKIRARVAALSGSLDELEAKLEPLLAQSLPETLVGLETVQQAKLQVAIPYLVYDLVFIYLKTCGIDPKTHPVITELDRIRQYFDKIKNAEDPDKRRNALDKAAANRFIKHAISQFKAMRPPGDQEAGPSHIRFDDEGNEQIPVRVTSKMIARAEYEKELKELGSEEEDDLEVFGNDEDAKMDNDSPEIASSRKGKGKEKAAKENMTQENTGQKRRRPPMDPFAGYGDDPKEPDQANTSQPRGNSVNAKQNDETQSSRSTPTSVSDSTSQPQTKRDKHAAKKARKKAKPTLQLPNAMNMRPCETLHPCRSSITGDSSFGRSHFVYKRTFGRVVWLFLTALGQSLRRRHTTANEVGMSSTRQGTYFVIVQARYSLPQERHRGCRLYFTSNNTTASLSRHNQSNPKLFPLFPEDHPISLPCRHWKTPWQGAAPRYLTPSSEPGPEHIFSRSSRRIIFGTTIS